MIGPLLLAATLANGAVQERALAVGTLVTSSFVPRDGRRVDVTAASFPVDRVTLHLHDVPTRAAAGAALRAIVEGTDPLAAINGGYFTAQHTPDGLFERDGVVEVPARPGLSGIVGSTADGTPVVAPARDAAALALRDAEQSGPFLVDPGGTHGIRRDDGARAPRSVVLLGGGRIAIVTTSACGLYDLASALVQQPQLFGVTTVERALNLDGGPSTGMAVREADGSYTLQPEAGPLRVIVTIDARP